jgi:hypothetical protein
MANGYCWGQRHHQISWDHRDPLHVRGGRHRRNDSPENSLLWAVESMQKMPKVRAPGKSMPAQQTSNTGEETHPPSPPQRELEVSTEKDSWRVALETNNGQHGKGAAGPRNEGIHRATNSSQKRS